MHSRKLHKLIYRVRHEYLTTNNIVLGAALLIALSWGWSSVQAVQRNYELQREVDFKNREKSLIELETENLKYEQRYYQSAEYQELELKRRLGLAQPGEKVLVLPKNSERAKIADDVSREESDIVTTNAVLPTPMEQWMEFLFGEKPNSGNRL